MPSSPRCPFLTAALTLLLLSSLCRAAQAEGGASIASAPTVAYGQQEFGSLNVGVLKSTECEVVPYRSWWALPVTAGDALQVDWEAQDSEALTNLFAAGTTDFDFPKTPPVTTSDLNDNLKAQLLYTATQTGTMLLEFFANEWCPKTPPGPYSFTAYVTHAMRLSLPRLGRLQGGAVQVGVHTPDGAPITDPTLTVSVQLLNHGHWHSVGTASPNNGIATVALRVPASLRGHRVAMRAVAGGPNYQRASSASQRVRVA